MMARSAWWLATWSICEALMVSGPASARADELMDMFHNSAPGFTHSTGLYAFQPPVGWECRQLRDSSVECRTNRGSAAAVCTITHLTIQGNLDAELMAVNAERDLKKLPHYRKLGGGRLLLGETKAALRSFTFDYQGNTEYPVAVEELYLVTGGKAIRLHFETMARAMPSYGGDLKQIYDTIGVAEVDVTGQIVQPAQLRNQKGRRKGH